jgi:glyoxylase-like metal-dependent hydrolase (beta-lactamase superfamily II)
MRAMGAAAIDYGYLTHFHDDHMNAIVDVAGRIPVTRMLDRAWPDYLPSSITGVQSRVPPFAGLRAPQESGDARTGRSVTS